MKDNCNSKEIDGGRETFNFITINYWWSKGLVEEKTLRSKHERNYDCKSKALTYSRAS
jgi:hypothetical protein